MSIVIMNGWRAGMQKVSLSQLQVEFLQIPLKNAKDNVDKLLEGQIIKINVDNEYIATEFVRRAEKLGVDCALEK